MIIGLVGKAGSGKDSVAKYLCEKHSFLRHAFADKLKDTIAELFHMSNTQLYDQSEKEKIDTRYGITPRRLLQYLGTDVCRNIYPDIWVDFVLREYDILCEHQTVNLIIPDVRFKNEAQKVQDKGGYLWRIVCPNNPKTEKLKDDADHVSETEMDTIKTDYTFSANYGELRGLYVRVSRYFNAFLRDEERK